MEVGVGVGVGEDEDVASAQAEALIATLAHRTKRFRITNSKLGFYKCNLHRVYCGHTRCHRLFSYKLPKSHWVVQMLRHILPPKRISCERLKIAPNKTLANVRFEGKSGHKR